MFLNPRVWGNPEQTGKPVLDDLREGKHTVLVATALVRATVPQQRALRNGFGKPDLTEAHADEIRGVLAATGARTTIEELIAQKYRQALDALSTADLRPAGSARLRDFACSVTNRTN